MNNLQKAKQALDEQMKTLGLETYTEWKRLENLFMTAKGICDEIETDENLHSFYKEHGL